MSHPMLRPCTTPLKLLAGTAAAALLFGWAAGAGAQTIDAEVPPPQQASLPPSSTMATSPSLPLGHDDVREVQNQLIALGFDPGPADGQVGPATIAAAQQYDHSRDGEGRVSIDAALLARLKADPGPRLTYDQVAARAQARQQARASQSPASVAPASGGSNQFGNIVQQIAPILGAVISNANANNNRGYGYGYGPGPGYYAPGPGYYGPGPGYYGPGPGYYGYGGF